MEKQKIRIGGTPHFAYVDDEGRYTLTISEKELIKNDLEIELQNGGTRKVTDWEENERGQLALTLANPE